MYNTPTGAKSAGTYDTKAEADRIAAAEEQFLRTGATGVSPAQRATVTIADYFDPWLRAHPVERSTKKSYKSYYRNHIQDQLGGVRVAELQREQVQAHFTKMQEDGKGVATQKRVRAVLSAMMTTARANGYRSDHPVHGIKVDRARRKKLTVLTTDQFGRVYRCLPTDGARLLANFIVRTGCRLGEAAALTVGDVNLERRRVSFDKAIQDLGAEWHPDGVSRFFVGMTKTHTDRDIPINVGLANALREWIETNGLGPTDLLFPRGLVAPVRRARRQRVDLSDPDVQAGLTFFVGPNLVKYQHGSVNGYVTGKCKCDYCGQAMADYRYQRNQKAKKPRSNVANPNGPTAPTGDPHAPIDRHRWGSVWKSACGKADLPFTPTAYQLRHTHASWLIENGEDPKTVMERLGHNDLSTTNLYVHMSDTQDESAADIMESLGDW